MEETDKPVFFDEDAAGTPRQVRVQPGIALRALSAALRDNHVTIPHGECPLVRIGGHVQTGGVGHQLRSLGFTLDWVRSFKMVTHDPAPGSAQGYVERTFHRPSSAPNAIVGDDDVFRAVLGGGPGSWGVLTEITFDLVPDTRYKKARGYSRTYLYDRKAFAAAMEQMRLWTERAGNGTLPPAVDLFISVVSGELDVILPSVALRPSVLLVETMALDEAGKGELKAVVRAVDSTLEAVDGAVNKLVGLLGDGVRGETDLSKIAHAGVRKTGIGGLPRTGREFDLPYKKSLYITLQPFTTKFRDDFVDLVDRVHQTRGLKVVFQGVVGGGAAAESLTETTHMQRRQALAQVVFDVFYEEGLAQVAVQFQEEMKRLLGEYSGGADLRMFVSV